MDRLTFKCTDCGHPVEAEGIPTESDLVKRWRGCQGRRVGGEAARHQPVGWRAVARLRLLRDLALVPAPLLARSIGIPPAPHHDCRSRRAPAERRIVPAARDQYQNRQNVGRAPQGPEWPPPAVVARLRLPELCCRRGLTPGSQQSMPGRPDPPPPGDAPASAAMAVPPEYRRLRKDRAAVRACRHDVLSAEGQPGPRKFNGSPATVYDDSMIGRAAVTAIV